MTFDNKSQSKEGVDKSANDQEKDSIDNSSKSKSIDNDLSAKLKKREIEQLGISSDEILEEEQKRQPFCNRE
jgi:hypothetical protein